MIEALFKDRETTLAQDLRFNLKRLLNEGAFDPKDVRLAILALAVSTRFKALADAARAELAQDGFSSPEIQEAAEIAAIMGMNNVYFRFRHYVGKEAPYRHSGLRMTGIARPVLGKLRFEMLAFAVSVLNGCESCVLTHEKSLREAGASVDQAHDLARLAGVIKGLSVLVSGDAG